MPELPRHDRHPGRLRAAAPVRRALACIVVCAVGSALVCTVTAMALSAVVLGAAPAYAAPITVRLSTPQYDSPGAWVPSIVTVSSPPAGYRVSLTIAATRGASVTCPGAVWRNPFAGTVSRRCYVRLPATPGRVDLTGTARLTRPGAPAIVRSGAGRPVLADGHRTATMTLAQARAVERCHNTTDHVRLTFDDGGSAAQVGSILDTLRRNRVRGTFFFRGDWAARHPALFDRIRRSGHWIGNHTYSHPPLSRTTEREVVRQLRLGTAATTTPRLLRPPFGAGALSSRLARIAGDSGYRLCRWTTDTYDWDDQTPVVMARRVRYGDHRSAPVAAGGNILMHGTGRHTAPGLQRIIDAVRAKGLTLQPLR